MNGRKLARIRCCRLCRHRIDVAPPNHGPNGYPRFCTAPDGDPIEIHDSYVEGPDSNCPEGHWAERVSIDANGHAVRQCWPHEEADTQDCGPADDAEAFSRWNREQGREMRRKKDKPKIRQTVRRIAKSKDIDADAVTVLAVLTAAGKVPGWMADEIRDEMRKST